MASHSVFMQSEMAILERLIRAEKAGFSAAGARSILKMDFEPADRERMHELAAKARAGTLTADEQAEADAYEVVGHLLGLLHSKARLSLAGTESEDPTAAIAPGILRSMQAFWRELPELLCKRRNRGRWAAYHGDERIGVDADRLKLASEIRRRGLSQDDYYIDRVEPHAQAPWEPEEVESLHSHGPDAFAPES